MTKQLAPDGHRGVVYHDGNLSTGGVATCQECGQMWNAKLMPFCPYCAFENEVRIALYEHIVKLPIDNSL